MTTITSVLYSATVQKDGRTSVYEVHTDNFGSQWPRSYLAPVGTDLNANMAAWAADLPAALQTMEINANVGNAINLGSLATTTFNYSTAAQSLFALRVAYSTATQLQAIMVGDFLSSLTDVQLQNAFGITSGQVTTLRTNKLTPAATLAASIRAAVGT